MPGDHRDQHPRSFEITDAPPVVSGDYLVVFAHSGSGPVRCRIAIKTLEQLGRRSTDPLELFAEKRSKLESILKTLYELGLFDDDGGITFSTAPW